MNVHLKRIPQPTDWIQNNASNPVDDLMNDTTILAYTCHTSRYGITHYYGPVILQKFNDTWLEFAEIPVKHLSSQIGIYAIISDLPSYISQRALNIVTKRTFGE